MTEGINFTSDEFTIEAPVLDAVKHPALRGVTLDKGAGVVGVNHANAGLGLLGGRDRVFSQNVGVYGESDQQGVFGHSTSATGTGVYGNSAGGGFGVRGDSTEGVAIQGQSFGNGRGVVGLTKTATAVQGICETSNNIDSPLESAEFRSVGVEGIGPVGVKGRGNTGIIGVGSPTGVYAFGDQAIFIKTATSNGNLLVGQSPRRFPPGVGESPHPYDTVFRVDSAGRGFFNGGTQANGADVAEFIEVSDNVESGDVVEIDPTHPALFRLAATPNSSAVAGVISTTPGVTLGAEAGLMTNATLRPQLALAGRVPVKASTENGTIRPGDLLVASSRPGHTMRSPVNPMPGTVIGKSLGSLAGDVGIIEMLVMLR
jgi:hypothetical protein